MEKTNGRKMEMSLTPLVALALVAFGCYLLRKGMGERPALSVVDKNAA